MSSNYAYITMATSKDYLPGVIAMYLSLKRTGTVISLYAMLPQALVESEPLAINNLKRNGINILEYNHSIEIPQQLIDNNAHQGDHRFSHTFDKLLIFELTQFDKIVYLDADLFILHSLNHLFNMPHMSATVAGKQYPGNETWIDINSGIMTIVPQQGIVAKFKTLIPDVIKVKGSCGDQDILQAYYTDWPNQHELNMGEKYNVFACYAKYYEQQLNYCYTNNIDNPKSIAVIHFIGENKPWMQHWSPLSVLKQELQLAILRLIGKRNTTAVLLEYKHLVRKARKLLYASK
ncbi:MAG: glycosyltransferase [bacterium]